VIARFEDFLAARWHEPLYLAEICAAIGVSERTLRSCCHEHFGVGPMRYLWLRRMSLAHRALMQAEAGKTTVTQIAISCGFGELGRFAVDYRVLFGEKPLATLRAPPDEGARGMAWRASGARFRRLYGWSTWQAPRSTNRSTRGP
jgi:AraC-like DNA-binding protein